MRKLARELRDGDHVWTPDDDEGQREAAAATCSNVACIIEAAIEDASWLSPTPSAEWFSSLCESCLQAKWQVH
jgi:hypothetical protein